VCATFLVSTKFSRSLVLEQGCSGWHKIQSAFSWVRMWGGSVPLVYAVQGAVTLAVAVTLGWLWRTRASFPLQAAALLIGTVLATPHVLDYDLVLLTPAIAFLAIDGAKRSFAPRQKTLLAALWLLPLAARSRRPRLFRWRCRSYCWCSSYCCAAAWPKPTAIPHRTQRPQNKIKLSSSIDWQVAGSMTARKFVTAFRQDL
jgi:hypothetical protein